MCADMPRSITLAITQGKCDSSRHTIKHTEKVKSNYISMYLNQIYVLTEPDKVDSSSAIIPTQVNYVNNPEYIIPPLC